VNPIVRVLFTTSSGLGHFHPLVPLARELAGAGHEVVFLCPPSLAPRVEAAGFRVKPTAAEPRPDPARQAAMQRIIGLPRGDVSNTAMIADIFVGLNSRRALPEVVALATAWKADVIVREEFEFAGAIAAEHLRIPHAAVQVGYGFDWMKLRSTNVGDSLNQLRSEWKLQADPELGMLFRYLLLSFDPPSLLEPADPLPTRHHVHAPAFDRAGTEARPDWLADAPAPIVYATLGSEAAKMPGVFPDIYEAIIAARREEPGTLVLTIGAARDPSELGPRPPNVHVERYIPQSTVLPRCELVITHGGHNTVLASLEAGIPMVIIPLFADQPENAARCAALKVAHVVPPSRLPSAELRDAAREILGDDSYRANAKRLRLEMEALPGVRHARVLLEGLKLRV
jgi:UDP:flavonoid glycosyltransferase YjiC (YdhE family)